MRTRREQALRNIAVAQGWPAYRTKALDVLTRLVKRHTIAPTP